MNLYDILNKATAKPHALSQEELMFLLEIRDEKEMQQLFHAAYGLKLRYTGKMVSIRGLIEMGNVCAKDCFYCGIRKSNGNAQRYRLSKEEILSCCEHGYELGFRTFVLQGGEDGYFTDDRLCDIVSSIRTGFPDCAITLSVGERSPESYQRLYDAGADR